MLKELFNVHVLKKSAIVANTTLDLMVNTTGVDDNGGRLLAMLPAFTKANVMFVLLLLLCWEGCAALGHILKPIFTFILKKLPIAANRQPRLNLPYVLQFTHGKSEEATVAGEAQVSHIDWYFVS
jgi:hypothetical protein